MSLHPSPPATDVAGQTQTLDVVVVSFRSRRLLRECLASLYEHLPLRRVELYVIDNDSDDGSVEMVFEEFPYAQVIESGANHGFAKAMNVGISAGSGEYVLALNPDARLTPGALDTLVAVLDRRPEVAAVGGRLELEDGSVDHATARSFPTLTGTIGHFTGLARRPRARGNLAQYRSVPDAPGPVDLVSGACMLLRRSALDEVGVFDERYWMYMEDIDLCYRLAQGGWKTWYEPEARVLHLKGGTVEGRRGPRLVWSFHAGMWRFYREHYAPDRSRLTTTAVYTGIGAKLLISLGRDLLWRTRRASDPISPRHLAVGLGGTSYTYSPAVHRGRLALRNKTRDRSENSPK